MKPAAKMAVVAVLVVGMAAAGASAIALIDSYEDGDLSEYGSFQGTGSASVTSTKSFHKSNSLSVDHDGGGSTFIGSTSIQNTPVPEGQNYTFTIRRDSGDTFLSRMWLNAKSETEEVPEGYFVELDLRDGGSSPGFSIRRGDGGSYTVLTSSSPSSGGATDAWMNITMIDTGSTVKAWWYDSDGTLITSLQASDSTYGASGGIGFGGGGNSDHDPYYIDYATHTVANSAPSINNTDFDPDSPLFGDSITTQVNATDADGDPMQAWANVSYGNGTPITGVQPMNQPVTGNFELQDHFTVGAAATYFMNYTVGDGIVNSTASDSFTVTDDPPTVTINQPQNQLYQNAPDYNVQFNDTDDAPGETYSWAVWRNGTLIDSGSGTENLTVTGTVTGSDQGANLFTANATDDRGNTGQNSIEYQFDDQPPIISISRPSPFEKNRTTIPLEYNVDDPRLDVCTYELDSNGTIIRRDSCGNVTNAFSFPEIGYHNVTLVANDTLGNTQTVVRNFTAGMTNYISLEEAGSGDSISTFSVEFSNSTGSTNGVNTTTGTAAFNTSATPYGNTTADIISPGYETVTTFYTVDGSFQADDTFQTTASGITLRVFDELTDQIIPGNITVSNATASQRYQGGLSNGTTISLDKADFSNNITYVNASEDDPVMVESAQYTVNYDLNANDNGEFSIGLTYADGITRYFCDVNNADNDPAETRQCDVRDGVITEAFVNVTDSDVGGSQGRVTVSDIKLKGRGILTGEYDALTANASLPVGDMTILAENSIRQPREYFLNWEGTSSQQLDMYLLETIEGNSMAIEVVDSSGNAVPGADITVQRKFGIVYKTISQATSGSDGGAGFFLDQSATYRVIVTHPDYFGFTGTFDPSNYQFEPLIVQLGKAGDFGFKTPWDDLAVSIEPDQLTLAPNATTFNGTVSDAQNRIDSYQLRIRNDTHLLNSSQTVTGQPSGGSVSVRGNLTQQTLGTEIEAILLIDRDGRQLNYTRTYRIGFDVNAGDYSIKTFMQQFRQRTNPAITGLLALIITVLISATFGSSLPIRNGAGFLSLGVLGFFTWGNWINPFLWILAFLGVLGIYLGTR